MLLWMDGFDHYGDGATGVANMDDGPYAEVDSAHVPSTTQARTGSRSLKLPGSNIGLTRRVFGADLTTVGVGAAVRLDNLPLESGVLIPFQFRDNANDMQLSISIETTGAIAAYRGDGGGTLLGTSTALLTADTWHHLEVKVSIHDSTGTVEVRLNGVTILNLTGQDTQATAIASTSQLVLRTRNNSGGADCYVDDLYAWDTTGSANNNFIGDRKVHTLFPNADGASEDWTRSTGADSFALVDDFPPNDDTDYISTATAGHLTALGFQDLPANVTGIAAVQAVYRARKTDAAATDVRTRARSGGTDANGTTRPMTTSYNYYQDIYETDPDTAAAWTRAGVDAAEIVLDRVT